MPTDDRAADDRTADDRTADDRTADDRTGADRKQAAFRALQERILSGEGQAPREQRASAFGHAGPPGPVARLLGHVAASPVRVTDADFAAAQAAGFTEDQLFELVICAAVGQAARQYDAGLAALAEAASGPAAGQEDG